MPTSSTVSRALWRLRYRAAPEVASEVRRRAVLATHHHCRLEVPRQVRLGPRFRVDIPDDGTLIVGRGCEFRDGFTCEISGSGRVAIGAGSIFTASALVQCSTSIEIGTRCVFGQACFIGDGNHRFRDHTRHILDQGYDYRPIVIEDGVMVLSKCTIVNSIGRGSIIGANSVVVKPIPAYCLAVGAPARVIHYFGPPELRPAELCD
ncbi:MAG TPA: acyltransferase [Acidimicrobiales bacterium]|nr:acyltransferase [Acidimicrobiales bacterium]